MKNEQLAKEIFKLTGPAENILHVTHCMTRLRLQLKCTDQELVENLKKLSDVLGVVEAEDSLQIILGPGKVNTVTEAFEAILAEASSQKMDAPQIGDGKALHDKIRKKNATPIKLLLKKIANIFIPLIPGFIACGLLTGCLAIAAKINPQLTGTAAFQLLSIAGSAVFWGMNLFIGCNASKEFGGTPIIGGVLGAFISHPGLNGITFGDFQIVSGRGGIIAVLLIAALAAYLEKRIRKIVPEILDLFMTPFLTVLISIGFAAFILQPIGGAISDFIGTLAINSIKEGGALTGFIFGGFFLPLVLLGVHQVFTPIHTDLLANYGVTILLPIFAMAGAGQVGASFAVYLKTKNKSLKKIIASALPVGIMGIGEPLIYGVTLPLGKPFITACIGGAFGGAVQASNVVGARALGISGLTLTPATDNAPCYLLGILTAYIAGFLATWVVGFDDPKEDTPEKDKKLLSAPLSGEILPLEKVHDPAFSKKLVGDGCAILPAEELVRSPADGEVTLIFPTNHAIGIKTTDGMELLLHIGIDTVKMEGDGFSSLVQEGQHIKKGESLLRFSLQKIQAAGYDSTFLLLVTNHKQFGTLQLTDKKKIQAGEQILSIN